MRTVFTLITGFFFLQAGFGQYVTVQQYVLEHKDLAIREMKRMGVPAAITLAQGILETENGNSDLVKKSNNHFGIKCKGTWTATTVSHDDDSEGECFRSYKDAEGSYRDHSNFLRGSDRYSFLFKLDPTDYKAWAYGLKKAGYATNPKYPQILIKNIEDNDLEQYTLEGVEGMPVYDASKYKSDPEEKFVYDSTIDAAAEAAVLPAVKTPVVATAVFDNRFQVNGVTCIYSRKGTSLLAIATDNNVNLNRLLEYNDLDHDGLLPKDELIFLEKKSKEGEKDFDIIQQDQSLYDLAQKNGIRLQSIYEYNPQLKDKSVYPGTKVLLKQVVEGDVAMNERPAIPTMLKTHEVQPKEGLYSISKKYGVTVSQIKEWNNLSDDNLRIGQQLIVSGSK